MAGQHAAWLAPAKEGLIPVALAQEVYGKSRVYKIHQFRDAAKLCHDSNVDLLDLMQRNGQQHRL